MTFANLVARLFGGFMVGVLCGLVPLFMATRRQRPGFAAGGFLGCVASGLVGGLVFAIPTAAILSFVLRRQTAAAPSSQVREDLSAARG